MKRFLLILLLAVSAGATNLKIFQDTITTSIDSALEYYDLSRMPDTQWSYIADSSCVLVRQGKWPFAIIPSKVVLFSKTNKQSKIYWYGDTTNKYLFNYGNINQASASSTFLNKGIISFWAFDDTTGGIIKNYSYDNSFNLQIQGTFFAKPGAIPNSQACSTSNIGSDYLYCSSNVMASFTQYTPFTVSLWYKPGYQNYGYADIFYSGSTTASSPFVFVELSPTTGPDIWITSTRTGSNLIQVGTTASPLSSGTWYKLDFTVDGSATAAGVNIYINGQKKATTTITDNLTATIATSGLTYFGYCGNGPIRDGGGGCFDDAKIFNHALDSMQIYNDFIASDTTKLTSKKTVTPANCLLIAGNSLSAAAQSDSIAKYRRLGEFAVNKGIGGSGVDTLIDSLPAWLPNYGITSALLEVATNDKPNTGSWLYTKLDSIWQCCHVYSATMPVNFCEVIPTRIDTPFEGNMHHAASDAQAKLTNSEIWRICINHGCYLSPMYLRIADTVAGLGSKMRNEYTTDGVHFNPVGLPFQTLAMQTSFIPTDMTFSFGTNSSRDPWSAWLRGSGVTISGDTISGSLAFAGAQDSGYSPVLHLFPYGNRVTFKTQMTSGAVHKLYRVSDYDFNRNATTAWTALSDTATTTKAFFQVCLVSDAAAVIDSFVIIADTLSPDTTTTTKYFGNRDGMIPIGFKDTYIYQNYPTSTYGYQVYFLMWDSVGRRCYGFINSNIDNYVPSYAIVKSVKLVQFIQNNGITGSGKLYLHRMLRQWGYYNCWAEYDANNYYGPTWTKANLGGGTIPTYPWGTDSFTIALDCAGSDSATILSTAQIGDSLVVDITDLYKAGMQYGLSMELKAPLQAVQLYSQQASDQTKRPYFAVTYITAASSGGNGVYYGGAILLTIGLAGIGWFRFGRKKTANQP